jgi:hypothetical protein
MNAGLLLIHFHFAGVLMENERAMIGFNFLKAIAVGKADLILDEFKMNRRADRPAVLLSCNCFHTGTNWRKFVKKKPRCARAFTSQRGCP